MVGPCTSFTTVFFTMLLSLVLLTHPSTNVVAFQALSQIPVRVYKAGADRAIFTSSSTLKMTKLSSYESLLEFNAQFKQGLKYVLVPQAPKTGSLPANEYDGTIPEILDAPVANSAMDYTSVGNFIPTKSYSSDIVDSTPIFQNIDVPKMNVEMPNINIELPNVQIPTILATTDTFNAMGRDVDQILHTKTLVINSDKLDAMGRDVDRVLQAARAVVSSSVEIASNMPIMEVASRANTKFTAAAAVANTKIVDPVVDRTMTQIKYAITHPPDYTDFTFTGAPPGQGLATPILNSISDAIKTARDTPPIFVADPLPDDYRTISYGFQAKVSAIEASQMIQTSIYNSAQKISANNAVVQEELKKVLDKELVLLQAQNTAIAEKVVAQSQSNIESLHRAQNAISARILDNAHELQDRFHTSEWTSNLEQRIIKSLQSSDIYQPDQLRTIITSLKMDTYGGLYAGTILGIVLILLAQNEKQSAIRATTAQITAETQRQIEQANSEKQRLEGMVMELTEAVGLLTEELRLLKSQRVQTNEVLASVQQEVEFVKNEKFAASMTKNKELREQLEATKAELQSIIDANVRTSRHNLCIQVFN
jgi:hypothetical protein